MTGIVIALALCVFAYGFWWGIWFTLAGGMYVTRYGTVDVRWPKKGMRGARLPRVNEERRGGDR